MHLHAKTTIELESITLATTTKTTYHTSGAGNDVDGSGNGNYATNSGVGSGRRAAAAIPPLQPPTIQPIAAVEPPNSQQNCPHCLDRCHYYLIKISLKTDSIFCVSVFVWLFTLRIIRTIYLLLLITLVLAIK